MRCVILFSGPFMSPTLFFLKNLRIEIESGDHRPPHVHVFGPDKRKVKAKIEMDTYKIVYSYGIDQKTLNQIIERLKELYDFVMEVWNEYSKE